MPELNIVVHAGSHPRRNCPVMVQIPADLVGGEDIAALAPGAGPIPAQVCPVHPLAGQPGGRDSLFAVFIVPELAAGESLPLTVRPASARGEGQGGVTVADDGKGSVAVHVAGELLTIYRYLHNPARPCFFPLLGPGGKRVTRSWPIADDVPGETRDHRHHRSMWVAHGNINGSDNWSEEEGHGVQLHRRLITACGGAAFGMVGALNDWNDSAGRKLLEERRLLTVYAVPGDSRLFDLDICFTATECDVRFGDTKEGGILALRVAPSMDGDHGGRIENSFGGIGEAECWGRRAQWCDYSGEVDGERLGIAVLDHPQSFRHPTYWHVRDYGMYTANPFGVHDFRNDPAADGSHFLPRGASLYFHYRVYLHRGSAAEARVAERYHDYANPPQVQMAPS